MFSAIWHVNLVHLKQVHTHVMLLPCSKSALCRHLFVLLLARCCCTLIDIIWFLFNDMFMLSSRVNSPLMWMLIQWKRHFLICSKKDKGRWDTGWRSNTSMAYPRTKLEQLHRGPLWLTRSGNNSWTCGLPQSTRYNSLISFTNVALQNMDWLSTNICLPIGKMS